MRWTPGLLKLILRIYWPYFFSGIKVTHIRNDWKELDVEMNLHWYNRNAVGTHFGGSLYSMVDPHFMLMLMQILGKQYIVWDKSAKIDFLKPGKGRVMAHVKLTDNEIDDIVEKTRNGQKYLPEFNIDIVNNSGDTIAKVHKTIYIKKK